MLSIGGDGVIRMTITMTKIQVFSSTQLKLTPTTATKNEIKVQ